MEENGNNQSGRLLSSRMTFFYKFVFPILWFPLSITLVVVFLAFPSLVPSEKEREIVIAVLVIIFIATGAFIIWAYARLKRVELVGNKLRVSNFFRIAEIDLKEVESITGSVLMNPELIWIHFSRPTEFDRKIMFMGQFRFFGGWSKHPIVKELQSMCANLTS